MSVMNHITQLLCKNGQIFAKMTKIEKVIASGVNVKREYLASEGLFAV